MRLRMQRVLTLVAFLACTHSVTAMAQEEPSGGSRPLNPMMSSLHWSPAQFYYVTSSEIYGAFGHVDAEAGFEIDELEQDAESSGQAFIALGVAQVPGTPVVAGLSVMQLTYDTEVTSKASGSLGDVTLKE